MTQQDATLSALQHYAYCRRQWGLIFLEQQWAENAHTAEGQVFHQTAHHGPEAELRGDTLILRGLRLESARLHLHGVSDWWSSTAAPAVLRCTDAKGCGCRTR